MRLIQLNFRRSFFVVIFILFLIYVYFCRYSCPWKFHWWKGNLTLCNLSMSESHGLFCESNEKWLERKNFYVQQREKNIFTMNEYENYFKENWSPEFQCQNEIRLGESDGGKWACDIEHLKTKPSCLVYSLGSGRDFRFEEAVHQHLPHCSIHTIDMQFSLCPENVCTFHHVQLGNGFNGTKTLRQLMIDLNHTDADIDILKIDIEYSEYVFFHLLFSNNRQFHSIFIRQILIEIHLVRERIFETNALFYLFNSQNYVIYHRELNRSFPFFACEYGFLKLNQTFLRGKS